MNKSLFPVLALGLLGLPAAPADLLLQNAPAQVFFSPRGSCTAALAVNIGAARKTVFVQACGLDSEPVIQALRQARERGVSVMVALDGSLGGGRDSVAESLARAGIPTWVDRAHTMAHNSLMVIDGEVVITGSFDYTRAAEEQNADNLLIIRDKGLAVLYRQNFDLHLGHAERVK
jgi:phosphatidylserine/phosphatidylglycerophosphate/cardiolipin synthase-like enzyme